MKLVIIEGPDRTGKNKIIESLLKKSENSIVRHWGTSVGHNDLEHKHHQFVEFDKEFKLASGRHAYDKHNLDRYPNDVYIWNRSHLGEFVYGQIYRDTNPSEWVIDLEKRYGFDTDPTIYLVQLIADPGFLYKQDDGKALHRDILDIEQEIELFKDAYDLSTIKNKILLKINDFDQYAQHHHTMNIINDFIQNT